MRQSRKKKFIDGKRERDKRRRIDRVRDLLEGDGVRDKTLMMLVIESATSLAIPGFKEDASVGRRATVWRDIGCRRR